MELGPKKGVAGPEESMIGHIQFSSMTDLLSINQRKKYVVAGPWAALLSDKRSLSLTTPVSVGHYNQHPSLSPPPKK